MDIVVNHTADVIYFAECEGKGACPYRSIADYPYQRRGGVSGAPINSGFTGERDGSAANFAKLKDPNYAYTVQVPPAERDIKRPAWLNDPIYYHNRGDSTLPRRIQHDGRLRRARRRLHREPARRARNDRHLRRLDRQVSASTASASTPRSTSIPSSGRSSFRRCSPARESEGHPELPHLRRSRDGRHGPGAHGREHARRQAAERARFRVPARGPRRRRGAMPAPTNWPSCSAPIRFTRAARKAALQLPTFVSNHDSPGAYRDGPSGARGRTPSDDEMLKRVCSPMRCC